MLIGKSGIFPSHIMTTSIPLWFTLPSQEGQTHALGERHSLHSYRYRKVSMFVCNMLLFAKEIQVTSKQLVTPSCSQEGVVLFPKLR